MRENEYVHDLQNLSIVLVEVKTVINLHTREASSHDKMTAIGSPLTGSDVICLVLKNALLSKVVPEMNLTTEITKSLIIINYYY